MSFILEKVRQLKKCLRTVLGSTGMANRLGGNDVLEGGGGKDIINGDGLIEAGFMNSVAVALHGAGFIDDDAIDLIAAHANCSWATGQFHCGIRRLFADRTWRRHRSGQPYPAGRWVTASDSNCGSVPCAA